MEGDRNTDPYARPTPEEIAAMVSPRRNLPSSNEVGSSPTDPPNGSNEVGSFKKPGPKEKYPWDEWLDGEYHVLIRGRDFAMSKVEFSTMVYNKARRRGGVAWVEGSLEGDMLGVQFFETAAARHVAKYKARGNGEGWWHEADEE